MPIKRTIDALEPKPLSSIFHEPGKYGFHHCPRCKSVIKWALVYCAHCGERGGNMPIAEAYEPGRK